MPQNIRPYNGVLKLASRKLDAAKYTDDNHGEKVKAVCGPEFHVFDCTAS